MGSSVKKIWIRTVMNASGTKKPQRLPMVKNQAPKNLVPKPKLK
jgi:hypothetical protein